MRKIVRLVLTGIFSYIFIAAVFNMTYYNNQYSSVKGKTYVNKITGETFIFRKVASAEDDILEMDFILSPGGFVGTEHIHLIQDEEFRVIAGQLTLYAEGKEFILKTGEEYTVKKGTSHRIWNEGRDSCHVLITFTPGNHLEDFFVTLCGLANEGKTNALGQPSFMQMMCLVNKHQIYIPGPPVFAQKALAFVLAPISVLMGNKEYYAEYF